MFRKNSKSCPGIRKFVRPVPEYLECPSCGGMVEIWSDEDVGICDTCNKKIGRLEERQSCLNWCEYGKECRTIIKRMKR